jgi:hypothetical protein
VTRTKRIGGHYLAGFVAAAALVHLAVTLFALVGEGAGAGHGRALDIFLVAGLLPALAALLLARKAWLEESDRSVGYATVGLVILLAALILSDPSELWPR